MPGPTLESNEGASFFPDDAMDGWDEQVRFSALEALVELCPRGNSMATEAVEKLLKDGWEVVSCTWATRKLALSPNPAPEATTQRRF